MLSWWFATDIHVLFFHSARITTQQLLPTKKSQHLINSVFNGKVTVSTSATETTTEYFYKLSGNKVIISDDETFDDNDMKLAISNMYQINMPQLLSITDTEANLATNQVGMWVTIGVGVLALLLVVTIPRRS